MDYSIDWTQQALDDLDQIHNFLCNFSESKANQTIEKILVRVEQLYTHPNSGQLEAELEGEPEDFKYLLVGYYKIIYAIENQNISIYAIFDTRQDPDKLEIKRQS